MYFILFKYKDLADKEKKKELFNEGCNSSTKTKARATEELITSIKSSIVPERLHRRERLSELTGKSNHSHGSYSKWLLPLL